MLASEVVIQPGTAVSCLAYAQDPANRAEIERTYACSSGDGLLASARFVCFRDISLLNIVHSDLSWRILNHGIFHDLHKHLSSARGSKKSLVSSINAGS